MVKYILFFIFLYNKFSGYKSNLHNITGNYILPLLNSSKVASYTGIDTNEGMLNEARKKAALLQGKGMRNISIQEASLLDTLLFEKGVFDVVMLNQVCTKIKIFSRRGIRESGSV